MVRYLHPQSSLPVDRSIYCVTKESSICIKLKETDSNLQSYSSTLPPTSFVVMSAGHRRRLSNPESQAQYLYEARGDAEAALDAYNLLKDDSVKNLAMQHNLPLLTYLADTHKISEQAYLTALKDLHSRKNTDYGDDSDLTLQQLVLSYNLALHFYFSREFEVAEKIIYPIFQMIQNKEEVFKDIYHGDIKCKIAFLSVDCMLEVYDVEIVKEILDWVEKYITAQSESSMDETSAIDCQPSFMEESDSELKFRLHCYRARYLFISAERDKTIVDANSKKARKELKNAMEIFNHRLSGKKSNAGSICDGGSAQDSVAVSLDSGIGNGNGICIDRHRSNNNNVTVMIGNGHDINDDNRSPFERKKSDTQYQHALYLKGRLEYLKGNAKKSLKLCSEAQNTATRNPGDEMTSIHHAMYNSNVAIVHQTSGQYFLAMHYYAHALEHIENARKECDWIREDGTNASGDGTMNQISVKQVMYNAAICAQKCGNYAASCECMLRYLEMSEVSATHPFPWLHLAESCIGKLKIVSQLPLSMVWLKNLLTRMHPVPFQECMRRRNVVTLLG